MDTVAVKEEAGHTKSRLSERRRARVSQIAIPLALIALMAIFQSQNSTFLTGENLKAIVVSAALPAIVACGLTVVLILGQFDLSFQAVAGFATTATAALFVTAAMPLWLVLILILAIAVAIGIFNGILVGYLKISALVVTIAVGSVLNGGEFAMTGSKPISGIPSGFTEFARSDVMGIPTLVVIAAVIAGLIWAMIDKTAFGRELRAVGGNAEAARFSGINVERVTVIGFIITALAAAIAGFLYTGRQGVVYPLTGLTVLLQSFAACFLGAAMFKIGQFNIPGTVVGVLFASIVANGLLLANVADYASYFFQGAILIAAVVFARLVTGGWRR